MTLTVLCDTRENKPFPFDDYPVETKDVKLETGDYAVQQRGYYNDKGNYKAPFAVERKAPDDFLKSITWERDRFKREIRRADGWDAPMPVVIEKPWLYFSQENYYRDIHSSQVEGTVDKWTAAYNVDFYFKNNRADAERLTYDFLKYWHNKN